MSHLFSTLQDAARRRESSRLEPGFQDALSFLRHWRAASTFPALVRLEACSALCRFSRDARIDRANDRAWLQNWLTSHRAYQWIPQQESSNVGAAAPVLYTFSPLEYATAMSERGELMFSTLSWFQNLSWVMPRCIGPTGQRRKVFPRKHTAPGRP